MSGRGSFNGWRAALLILVRVGLLGSGCSLVSCGQPAGRQPPAPAWPTNLRWEIPAEGTAVVPIDARPPAPAPAAAAEPGGQDVIGDLFNLGHELTREVDRQAQEALALTLTEQRQVGEGLYQQLTAQCPVLTDRRLAQRIGPVVAALRPYCPEVFTHLQVTILDDPEINAFATVGGYVYVNRGLLTLLSTDAELQFVLAHELAHLHLGHCAAKVTYAARAGQVAEDLTPLVQVLYQAVALGYSEADELAADTWAMRVQQRLGVTPPAALAAGTKLQQRAASRGAAAPAYPPELPAAAQRTLRELDRHFQSHPDWETRLANLRRVAAER